MVRADWLRREANGVYGLPREGAGNYVPGDQAVLNALAAGAHTFDELVTATGLPEGAVTAAIHRLKERKVVILKDRGKNATYALAGTASPHVYTREAVIDALRSGKRMTVSELVPHTGKGRGEIYAALHRLEDEGLVKRFETTHQFPHREKPNNCNELRRKAANLRTKFRSKTCCRIAVWCSL
jgi:DNA-binding transcriptional ArsR family regulator